MDCQRCQSKRIIHVSGKTSDMCWAKFGNREHDGYVPQIKPIGNGGDYLTFKLCLDCGQIQGQFPVDDEFLEDFPEAYT